MIKRAAIARAAVNCKTVIPLQTGIQAPLRISGALDSRLRGNDGLGGGGMNTAVMLLSAMEAAESYA
jgi:hypothetical protein